MNIKLRKVEEKDIDALWKMQYYAALLDTENRPIVDIKNHPSSIYVEKWGRKGDFGFVAISDETQIVGATWCRLFNEEKKRVRFY